MSPCTTQIRASGPNTSRRNRAGRSARWASTADHPSGLGDGGDVPSGAEANRRLPQTQLEAQVVGEGAVLAGVDQPVGHATPIEGPQDRCRLDVLRLGAEEDR